MAFARAANEARGDQSDKIQAVNALIAVLESKKVRKVSFDTMLSNHALVWQIKVIQQVALHRIVALARSCLTMWASEDIYGAAYFARATLETTAIVYDLSRRLEAAVDNRDLVMARDLLARQMFGSSHPDRPRHAPTAKTMEAKAIISEMDEKYPGTLSAYNQLCDTCRPVTLNLFSISVIIDQDTRDATFDTFEQYNKIVFNDVIIACGLLRVFDQALQNIHNTALSLSSPIN